MASLSGNFPSVLGGSSFGLDGFLGQSNTGGFNLSQSGGVMDLVSGGLSFLGPAGAVAGMFLGPLEDLAGDIFGKRNSAEHFEQGGLDMLAKLYEGVAAQHSNNPLNYVNELSKGLYFLKKCYELFLGNSSHPNTKKGHAANVENCDKAIFDLSNTLTQIFPNDTLKKVVVTKSMTKEQYSGKVMFKGAKDVTYPIYSIEEKTLATTFNKKTSTVDSNGNTVVSSSVDVGKVLGWVVAPFVIVGGLVYLIFKKK